MNNLPTTPGSLIMWDHPKLHEDLSRSMGSVWQLHDGGFWVELTSNGKHGAQFNTESLPRLIGDDWQVLYEAGPDPDMTEQLRRLINDREDAQKSLDHRTRDLESLDQQIERLQGHIRAANERTTDEH